MASFNDVEIPELLGRRWSPKDEGTGNVEMDPLGTVFSSCPGRL